MRSHFESVINICFCSQEMPKGTNKLVWIVVGKKCLFCVFLLFFPSFLFPLFPLPSLCLLLFGSIVSLKLLFIFAHEFRDLLNLGIAFHHVYEAFYHIFHEIFISNQFSIFCLKPLMYTYKMHPQSVTEAFYLTISGIL